MLGWSSAHSGGQPRAAAFRADDLRCTEGVARLAANALRLESARWRERLDTTGPARARRARRHAGQSVGGALFAAEVLGVDLDEVLPLGRHGALLEDRREGAGRL